MVTAKAYNNQVKMGKKWLLLCLNKTICLRIVMKKPLLTGVWLLDLFKSLAVMQVQADNNSSMLSMLITNKNNKNMK